MCRLHIKIQCFLPRFSVIFYNWAFLAVFSSLSRGAAVVTTGAVSAPRPHAAAALPTVVACPGTAASLRARSFPATCTAGATLAAAGAASAAGPAVADHLAENQRHNDYKNRGDNNCSDVICEPCHDKCLLCLFPLSATPLFTCLKPPGFIGFQWFQRNFVVCIVIVSVSFSSPPCLRLQTQWFSFFFLFSIEFAPNHPFSHL